MRFAGACRANAPFTTGATTTFRKGLLMTTSTLSRPALDRLRGLAYWDLGEVVRDCLRQAEPGTARAVIAKLIAEHGYVDGPRFLFSLARLARDFTRRQYPHWLKTIPADQLILIASLCDPRDRQELLRRLPSRPMSYREVERRVRALERRRRGGSLMNTRHPSGQADDDAGLAAYNLLFAARQVLDLHRRHRLPPLHPVRASRRGPPGRGRRHPQRIVASPWPLRPADPRRAG